MILNLPKNSTFLAAVVFATVGVVAYVVHQFICIDYLGAGGSLLVVAAFILLCANSIKLNLPKNSTFWAAVTIEAIGMVVYVLHLFHQALQILDMISFLLFVTAFILLILGLNPKEL